MMAMGQRPEVGIVGARLVYPITGRIQHAGVILGVGAADNIYNNILGLNDPGYMGRAQVDQNLSAVTGACLLIRKTLYDAVHGLDETDLKILFSDIDLCLKVAKLKSRIVWTPHAILLHHGSGSIKKKKEDEAQWLEYRKKASYEVGFMYFRWLPQLAHDPAYNRNLTLDSVDFNIEKNAIVRWDPNFHDRPHILGVQRKKGSAHRMAFPFRVLDDTLLARCEVINTFGRRGGFMPTEVKRLKPDTIYFHEALQSDDVEDMRNYRYFNKTFCVYSLDCLITDLPESDLLARYGLADKKAVEVRFREMLSLCHRLIVTSSPLAEMCKGMIRDIRIIPDYLERGVWGDLSSQRRQGRYPRVGVVSAQLADTRCIETIIAEMAQEVEWIGLGPCPEGLQPYMKEIYYPPDSCSDYAEGLAKLNLDLAVVPMEVNRVNEAYSNLPLLELGVLGCPVICTDIPPFREAPVKRVPNDPKVWAEAIYERILDLDAAAREGDRLKQWVLDHAILEDHVKEWLSALLPS